jgi:hypothetical protein
MHLVDSPKRLLTALTVPVMLAALTLGGWFVGRHATQISDLFIGAYLQHYNAVTPGDKLEYFVTATDKTALANLVADTPGLDELRDTRYRNLYTVAVNGVARRTLVNKMRSTPSITAVFNIPFFCH